MTESTIQYLLHHKSELFRDKCLWIFIFFCTLVSIGQLVIAVLTESLGNLADCIHRVDHILEFIIIVIANVLDKRKKDDRYTYGYGRHEFLYVFTLKLSVIIICCFLLFETVHGIMDGHHSHIDEISPELQKYSDYIGYISFFISLIMIFGFTHYKKQFHNRYSSDIFRAEAPIQHHITGSDIVHIFIDLSTIAFTVISNYLSMKKGVILADLIECCVMCIFMMYTSWSDLANSASVLVLGISDDLAQEIKTAMKRVSLLDGVVNIKESQYWVESPGRLVGSITVITTQETNIKHLKTDIQNICSHTFQELAIQIDQQPSYTWLQ